MSESSPKSIILDILKQHPEGLTLSSLAEKSGIHRHTSRKYVNELVRSGDVIQRLVGAAKLCYPSCVSNNINEKKKSFLSKFNIKLISSVILIALIISEIAISAYANESEIFINKSSNISPITSSFVFNEDFQLNEVIETAIKNASGSVERNDSLVPAPIETPSDMHLEFSVNMNYPEKITRGEAFTIKTNITNIGSLTAKNILLTLQLPEGFEFVSSSSDCDQLEPSETCISEIVVNSMISTPLGLSDLKIVVNYEE